MMSSRLSFPVAFAVLALCSLAPAAASVGFDGTELLGEPIRLQDEGVGGLLLETEVPGVYLPAPTAETEIEVSVVGLTARARVRQSFTNPTDVWVDGLYAFPLPEDAAVDSLFMQVGERVIEGEIHERAEARRIFAEARDSGRRATLLEQKRPNLFTTEVANLGPGERIEVTLEYQEQLTFDGGIVALTVPMVAAPRYLPKSPWPSPDWVDPAVGSGGGFGRVELEVTLDAGFPVERMGSLSHGIATTKAGGSAYRVRLDPGASGTVTGTRDFVLEWAPAVGDEPRAAVWSEEVGGDTYALVMVMPPSEGSVSELDLPREVVFVVDTSGSMEGASLAQARQAVLWALERLRSQDSFNVIEFNSFASKLFPASVPAGPQALRQARGFVAGLQATGGTEMMTALEAALGTPAVPGAVRQVVFATDGSVGNEAELARYIETHRGASRLFPVGIGSAPNRHFIERAATVGRGTATTIADPAEVGVKMAELFAKLSRPVATDLAVQWSDPRVETWPAVLPDLYWGEPVMLTARLPAGAPETLEITGRLGDESFRLTPRLRDGRVRAAGVEKLWAREKIASLSGGLLDVEHYDATREEILAVALEHHLVSDFTSLVAVERTPAVAPAMRLATARLPVTLPEGWAAAGYGALPQTATQWRLLILLGGILILAGLWIRAVGAIFGRAGTVHVAGAGR